jgi:hypothetical protein
MGSVPTNKHKLHSTIFEDLEAKKMTEMECQIPDFREVSDSDAESIAMEMDFTAKNIAQISAQMAAAKVKDISILWHKRHCFIGKLSKQIKEMESIETNIP